MKDNEEIIEMTLNADGEYELDTRQHARKKKSQRHATVTEEATINQPRAIMRKRGVTYTGHIEELLEGFQLGMDMIKEFQKTLGKYR